MSVVNLQRLFSASSPLYFAGFTEFKTVARIGLFESYESYDMISTPSVLLVIVYFEVYRFSRLIFKQV